MSTTGILALDLGSKTGWAFAEQKGEPMHSGLINTTPTRFESQGARYLKFEAAIRALIQTWNPRVVVFERVHRHSSTIAAQVWGAYSAILMKLCDETETEYVGFSVQAIKQHATGKGNASKELMVAAAERRFPEQDILTDDVADAIHLLQLAHDSLKLA